MTLVGGRDQDGLVDVSGTVGDDGILDELLTGLVAKGGDEKRISVVRINDAVVVFWKSALVMTLDVTLLTKDLLAKDGDVAEGVRHDACRLMLF